MILIADSGSTNTDWAILKKSETFRFQSIGLNPYFLNEEQITNAILTNFPIEINPAEIQQIYFYGSGCGSDKTKPIIYNALNKLFLKSTIKIDTDLMA
ncbi:MAG TPA: ATPase, partial [Bacteroidales bacterium]|nr:ATPase [Bacteroidales bacterium]